LAGIILKIFLVKELLP